MNKKVRIGLLIASILFAGGTVFTAHTLRTQAQLAFIPFGGPILRVDTSRCCNGDIITIQDAVTKAPLDLIFYNDGSSHLFQYYQYRVVGTNVLGDYLPAGACAEKSGECVVFSLLNGGSIQKIGTSLAP